MFDEELLLLVKFYDMKTNTNILKPPSTDWHLLLAQELKKENCGIEEKTGNSLELIGIGNDFLNRKPMVHALLRSTLINGTS